jgi:D-3-phosphoglycerate dehydrogenase / 2-oxoglutarate reductase
MNEKPIKVLFSAPFSFLLEFLDEYIEEYDVEFREIWQVSDIPDQAHHYDIWIPNPGQNFIIEDEILENFSSLKLISTPSTGTNHISIKDCTKRSVKVFGLMDQRQGLNQISASAEFTFLKILASLRNLRESWNEVSDSRWRHNEDDMRGYEVKEKSYGLVGMGRIGNKIVQYLDSFGATNIAFYDIAVDQDDLDKAKFAILENIFETSDVVVICVALNVETKGMVDLNLLSKLKRHAHLINTSRGEIINEDDLITVLESRKDIKFSADVLSGEVESGSLNKQLLLLHKSNRINITPHIAGATYGSQKKAATLAFDIIKSNV